MKHITVNASIELTIAFDEASLKKSVREMVSNAGNPP
jgi:hypothetical protein